MAGHPERRTRRLGRSCLLALGICLAASTPGALVAGGPRLWLGPASAQGFTRAAAVTLLALAAALALRRLTAKKPYQYPRAPFPQARQPPSGTESIAVIGGGPAGSTFALCAQQWGLPVTVYDRLPHLVPDESSYINFKNVGLKALGEVSPELEKALRENPSNLSPYTPIKTAAGETMVTINDPSAILLRRNELSSIITAHCKTNVQYGKEVVEVEEAEAGALVRFADGSVAKHSLAVMCCGSRVRKVKSPLKVQPRFYKKWLLRRVKDPETAASMPTHEQLFFGKAGKLIFTFPGEYLLISQNGKELGGMSAEELQREFGDFTGEVGGKFAGGLQQLVAGTEWHREKQYITWRSPPPKSWFVGRAVAVGDACHPMTPATGSGASMAVLDAIELACQLAKVQWWSPEEMRAALARYQELRETQIKQLWRIDSLRNGMNDMQNPLAVLLRDMLYGVVFKITTTLAKRRTLR